MVKHYFRHANIQPEGTCSLIYPLWALHQTTVIFTHSPGILNSEWIPKNIKLVEPVKGCSGCCLRFKSERTKWCNANISQWCSKEVPSEEDVMLRLCTHCSWCFKGAWLHLLQLSSSLLGWPVCKCYIPTYNYVTSTHLYCITYLKTVNLN